MKNVQALGNPYEMRCGPIFLFFLKVYLGVILVPEFLEKGKIGNTIK